MIWFWIALSAAFVVVGLVIADKARRPTVEFLGHTIAGLALASFVVAVALAVLVEAFARDVDGRYAASPLKPWFDQLKSGKGLCCSDADGTALSDVDWESKDGHYRVRIEGEWYDVPDDAVITEPNRAGRTMVWPIRYRDNGKSTFGIRCFMPGSMT